MKKTITSIFFVPTLKIGRDKLMKYGYLNGYQKDTGREVQYKNCIYVLFKPEDMDLFREFLDGEYDRTKDVVDDYDYDDGFVVVVYTLPNRIKKDYELIRQGKYSKTSLEFQGLFPKIVKVTKNGYQRDEISLQYRIFNKTEDLRKYWEEKIGINFNEGMEVWSVWNEEDEILDINKIKEHV
jgi:hypothetical protein